MNFPAQRSGFCPALTVVALMLSSTVHPGQTDLHCGDTKVSSEGPAAFTPGNCSFSFSNRRLGLVTGFVPGGLYNVSLLCDVIGSGLVRAIHIRVLVAGNHTTRLLPILTDVCSENNKSKNVSGSLSRLQFKWEAPQADMENLCVNFSVKYVDDEGTLYRFTHEVCKIFGCFHYFHADTGHVTSQNYPLRYQNNLNCTYYIVPESGRHLHLQFQQLDLEPPYDGQCFDHVTVVGAGTPALQHCGTFSDFAAENMFFSAENGYFEIHFLSDMKISGKGFSALFYTLEPSECNVTVTSLSGHISSVSYPRAYYPSMDCTIKIRVPDTYTVRVVVHDMDIPSSDDCRRDYVQISTRSDVGNTSLMPEWRRCGSDKDYYNTELIFDSSGPSVDVHFHSDHLKEGKGLRAFYRAIESCGNETETDIHGTLASQNYPQNYSNSQDCSSVIEFNTSAYRVELKFHMLHTESAGGVASVDEQCILDYVEIDNGERVLRRCGNWQGREGELHFQSWGNTLVIRFVSNDRITAPGFRVTWNAILSDTSGALCPQGWEDLENSCFQINHDLSSWFEGRLACQGRGAQLVSVRDEQTHIFIQAEIKSRLNESFPQTYWIGANDRLFENDFYWADGTRVETFYWFPGWPEYGYDVRQPSDDGYANEDCVELRRNFRLPLKGYKQTTEFYWNDRNCEEKNGYICQMYKHQVDRPKPQERPSCNVSIDLSPHSPSGRITSPGYPANYSDFLQCIYSIRAPTGYRIEVEFDTFDVEESESCTFDYLVMSPFALSTAPSPQRLCGNYVKRLKLLHHLSVSNQLTITFHTDHNVVAGGFAASLRVVDASWTCGNGSWIAFGIHCYAIFLSTPLVHSLASALCLDMDAELAGPSTDDQKIFVANLLSRSSSGEGEIWMPGVEDDRCSTLSLASETEPRLVRGSEACSAKLGFICSRPSGDAAQTRDEMTSTELNGEWRLTQISGQLYNNQVESILHITMPESYRIALNISSMDIEYQENCLYDSLTILEVEQGNKSKTFCGRESGDLPYVTSGNQVTIRFQSDYSIGGRGFALTWLGYNISLCNSESDAFQGVLQSFNNPVSYFDNMDCVMSIDAPLGFRIYLEIRLLDLSRSGNCSDYLEVDLGGAVTRLCSQSNVENGMLSYLSSASGMTLTFHSDAGGGGRGFVARFRRVVAASLRIDSVLDVTNKRFGVLSSVNKQVGGVNDIAQTIELQASLGWMIHLELVHLSTITNQSRGCNDTFLEIADTAVEGLGLTTSFPLCLPDQETIVTPPTVKTTLSQLHEVSVRFVTGDIDHSASPGFSILYKVLPDPDFFNKTKNVTDLTFPACLDGPYSCYNGGSCSSSPTGGFRCKCRGYYTGLLCHATWCEVDSCVKGACNLTSTYYTCICEPGYFGTYCELDSDTCRTKLCSNHGACWREHEHNVVCECDLGYSGAQCSSRSSLPMLTPRTASQRLLEEPIWIGLIVILSLVLIFVIMFCVKRKCSRRLENCCCQDKTKKKQQEQNGRVDHGIPSPSLPSYNRYLSREPSPLDFRRQPEIHIEEVPDERLVQYRDRPTKEAGLEFAYENPAHESHFSSERDRSVAPRYPEVKETSSTMEPSVAGSFVLNADQINTESSAENPLAVLKLRPSETREPISRLNRSYSSTPMIHRHSANFSAIPRPKSLEGVEHHFYPHIIINNDLDLESTTDDGLVASVGQTLDEKPEMCAPQMRQMHSLSIPTDPIVQPADYYVGYDAKKRRRDFALKSHSANAMYNMKPRSHPRWCLWDHSSSTESEFRGATRARRDIWNTGSYDVATYSDSGLGHQSSYESCHSCHSSCRKQRTCQCRKCIKYDRRHHHKSSGRSRHGRHKMTGSHSDVTSYLVETTSSAESDRRSGRQKLHGESKHSGRRTLRRHETVEKCDSSNSEKDYKRPPRRSLRRVKSQDTDCASSKGVSHKYTDEEASGRRKSRSSSDLVLNVPVSIDIKQVNSFETSSNYESNDSLLSKVPDRSERQSDDIAVISKIYDIIDRTGLNAPDVTITVLSSSEEEYSGDCNPEGLTQSLTVTQTDSAISSAPKSVQPSPRRFPRELSAPQPTPEPTTTHSNNNFKDSAYQTKENSTDKSNSKTTSSAPSPEMTRGLERYEKAFSSWTSARSDERRVTSQLQQAAMKLIQLQRRSQEKKILRNGRIHTSGQEDGFVQDDDLKGCLPLSRLTTLDTSRRRSGKLRRLHSLNRESSLQEVTEENSPVVPEDAYQSAPETFVQGKSQNGCFDFSVNSGEAIEMKELS